MIASSQYHINTLKSCTIKSNLGSANEFINKIFIKIESNETNEISSTKLSNKNLNYVFNEQICDINSKVRLDKIIEKNKENSSQNTILNDLKISSNLDANFQTNIVKHDMHNSKSNYKKLRKKIHDPTINNVITSSTLKYGFLALTTLFFICIFLFFIVIGILGLDLCGIYRKIPIYLLVMGATGIVYIFIYYSCPFDYSKSPISKMYEHLIWRLIINRCRASYFLSNLHGSSLYENSGKSYSDLNFCSKFNVKLSCCSSFILKFFCCDCCCFNCCKGILKETRKSLTQDIVYEVSEKATSNYSSISSSYSNSISNQSNQSLPEDNFANRLYPSISTNSTIEQPWRIKKSPTSNSLNKPVNKGIKRSKSASELSSRINRKKNPTDKKRAKSLSDNNNLGNRYFNGHYGHKYGSHRHLYKHHKKTHQPIKIFDLNSIRYCIFFLFKRALQLFLLIWFFCGNYWVFNPEFVVSQKSKKVVNASRFVDIESNNVYLENNLENSKVYFLRSFNDFNLVNKTNSSTFVDLICFDIAFYHVIVFYCTFGFIAFLAIVYKLYLIIFNNKKKNKALCK
ncbi:unnamed protein product [Brachionus calyciflorus]|uniref:Uncharacterized protein n=1 Tax=Brachionus calyciflorus TaxID=104777 RepID=A0A813XZN0_9BILA|nr:unnamed protein product [Brachionus calyciflorus]